MQPRSEPLLWLQCLALGAIPLELLLIRLVLAGADPGPVPGVGRFLIWGVGVLAPAVALCRRPADWGSLLLVRQPLANRNSDQLRISASHSGLIGRIAVVMAAAILLPVLWWLDDSAVLASEFSPVSEQSRLVTLLLVSPLLALIVWQVQQLVQATTQLLGSAATDGSADPAFRADAVATQRTSLGLQLLNIPSLDWPEPVLGTPKADVVDASPEAESPVNGEATDQTSPQRGDEAMGEAPAETEADSGTENASTENVGSEDEAPEVESSAIHLATAEMDNGTDTEPDTHSSDEEKPEADDADVKVAEAKATEDEVTEDEGGSETDDSRDANPSAPVESPPESPQSSVATTAPLPVEPEQAGEEEEGAALNGEISQVDSVSGGSAEGHREQAEPSGGKQSEPEQSSEPPPGSL